MENRASIRLDSAACVVELIIQGGRLLARERATSCERRGRRGRRGIRVSEVKRALVHRSKNVGTERPSLFAARSFVMEQRRKFLAREVSSTVGEGERGDFKTYLESLSFSLRSYPVFSSFFFFFEERREEGLFFFPDDVFKKNDGNRSSRGDLSSDFCSSGRMTLCRVTHKRCVTR